MLGGLELGRVWGNSEFVELASRKSSIQQLDVCESGPVSS